mmetsp:Transcript_40548/g.127818  ORF Transcript_40548/g.127818 Transcript_40548/m.127818 type:complete len:81 (+) Transcript_40548:1681-1923(+)
MTEMGYAMLHEPTAENGDDVVQMTDSEFLLHENRTQDEEEKRTIMMQRQRKLSSLQYCIELLSRPARPRITSATGSELQL